MSYVFECLSCGATTDPADRPAGCPDCGGRLEVAFEDSVLPDELPGNEERADRTDAGRFDRTDLWRYADWLPTESLALGDDGAPRAAMGEGWTPLVEASQCAAAVTDVHAETASVPDHGSDGPAVYLKNETANPTWSWKDRLAAVVVPHAIADSDADRIATASTGNHASAVAAYASRAGVERVLAFVSPSSDPPHHRQIRAYGGEAVRLSEYAERKRFLAELADRGWFVAYDLDGYFTGQPYVYEGYKTVAFEIVEQLGRVPDAVVAPVGAGDGFYGIWKGFRELFARGVVSETPKMVSAESEERHPLAAAYEADAESVGRDEGPEPLSTSTMGTTSGDHALAAIRASDGAAYAAARKRVEAAIRTCGRDGIFLEPASALAPAVIPQAVTDGLVSPADTVVAVGSGAGVAWPEATASAVGDSATVEPTRDALADAVPFALD